MTTDLDAILSSPAYAPRYGWHDDHRAHDGTPAYLPAMQQVRSEFTELLDLCRSRGLWHRCLQLGMGECDASHAVWQSRFARVVTIDWWVCAVGDEALPGADTRSADAIKLALANGPYDLIFIDAGHSYRDVEHDHLSYGPMRTPGGVIAFHDALPRPAYSEVGVPAYLATLPGVRVIGDEVGIGWV
jgi:hypothetical protein